MYNIVHYIMRAKEQLNHMCAPLLSSKHSPLFDQRLFLIHFFSFFQENTEKPFEGITHKTSEVQQFESDPALLYTYNVHMADAGILTLLIDWTIFRNSWQVDNTPFFCITVKGYDNCIISYTSFSARLQMNHLSTLAGNQILSSVLNENLSCTQTLHNVILCLYG